MSDNPADSRRARGEVSEYFNDTLVVELNDLELIRRELGSIRVVSEQSSRELDLALLKLDGLEDAFRDDRKAELMRAATADTEHPYRLTMDSPELDFLIFELRRKFERDYEGWPVTIGKDRLVGGVEGSPHTGGSKDFPVKVSANEVKLPKRGSVAGDRVRIGLLDTRIFRHPKLDGRYLADFETLLPDESPFNSTAGHATFIAGLILAQAPNADLVVRWVLDDHATSHSSWDVAHQMVAFLDEDVSLLNISFGCATDDNQPPLLLRRAIERLTPTVTVIAAAGNHGDLNPSIQGSHCLLRSNKTPLWPAAFDEVVAVGSATNGALSSFSPGVPWVDFLTPGEGVRSTYLEGQVDVVSRDQLCTQVNHGREEFAGYAEWTGTSFSAGTLVGAIAAIAETHQIGARDAVDRLMNQSYDPDLFPAARQVRPFQLAKSKPE